MNLLRYSCQIALPGFSDATQQKLSDSKVLIVGAGGLGCPAAQYLASTGIGTLGIADYDVVSISNLHRQILFGPDDEGKSKSTLACKRLRKQNPSIKIVEHNIEITPDNVLQIISDYEIIVDCTDNFETRYLLNDACFIAKKPLVYGAIYQYEGQAAVWNLENADGSMSPNYRDLFPSVDPSEIPNCSEGGVIPPIAGIIGCLQANEVIKIITRSGNSLAGKLLVIDALTCESRIINIGNTTKFNISILQPSDKLPSLSIQQFDEFKQSNNIQLIDVRTSEERVNFNIEGLHLPLDSIKNNPGLTITIDHPVIVYCESGRRSEEAGKLLRKMFPDKIFYSLKGGLKAYKLFHQG